ncbi:MAG: twin transmembrane helix small protein [Proteobacteria bacterium]|nr:twin transmembrane helix small protein [Pseudomonadota bacterium]
MELFRLVVIGTLLAILLSLASALYHLTTGKGDSRKMLRALTWRIGLSVLLFALLILAARQGWIVPHGVGH